MKEYQFSLDNTRPSKVFLCPACGKKEFKLYLDTQTGEYISMQVGKCNRVVKCNYHYTPKQYFQDNQLPDKQQIQNKPIIVTPPKPSYLPKESFDKSYGTAHPNHFLTYLRSLFHDKIAIQLVNRFNIGTSKYWQGATVFWQIDRWSKIRTGKIMLYHPNTGKRVKEPYSHINWVHSVLEKQGKLTDFRLKQCLFGEHQLVNEPKSKQIAIVESEKTAILASVFLPNFIWLAAGSLTNLTPERCEVLAGRNLMLYPDLGVADTTGQTPFDKWQEKGSLLRKKLACKVFVSEILEQEADETERAKGLDIADFFLQRDDHFGWALTADDYPVFWG
ncbi:MAG: DUF6371 domain-containing protein [Spirosomataceae bacterium]